MISASALMRSCILGIVLALTLPLPSIAEAVGWRASKIAKRFTTMTTNSKGRVQTPTLGFEVERELEREALRQQGSPGKGGN